MHSTFKIRQADDKMRLNEANVECDIKEKYRKLIKIPSEMTKLHQIHVKT